MKKLWTGIDLRGLAYGGDGHAGVFFSTAEEAVEILKVGETFKEKFLRDFAGESTFFVNTTHEGQVYNQYQIWFLPEIVEEIRK